MISPYENQARAHVSVYADRPRIGGRKTYLFAFIDDHSRAIVGHWFGFAEDTVRLAAALRPALSARGVPGTGGGRPVDPHRNRRQGAVGDRTDLDRCLGRARQRRLPDTLLTHVPQDDLLRRVEDYHCLMTT
ncbi:hypothetical protein ACVWXU_002002 [Streptomyces sp. TE33382]